jgi:hypothetical protein
MVLIRTIGAGRPVLGSWQARRAADGSLAQCQDERATNSK